MSGTATSELLAWVPRVRSAAERTWQRVDRMLLRLQGRVDTPAYDTWIPRVIAALHAALLILLVLARYHSLDLGAETAKYVQATWQIGEGLRPDTTLANGNLIGEQGSLILYPLGLLTTVLPRAETLLVLKSLALALAIIPLWRLGRRHGQLGIGATSAVVFAYSIYSAVHAMNAADFAPAILAVPALMWAVLLGFDERKRWMVVSIIFALCCRADLGLAIAGLGVLLLIERRKRVGLIALLLGSGWFLLAIYGLQPGFGDGSYSYLLPYADFGDTPLSVLTGIVSHPVRFLKLVFTQLNFFSLVTLFAPVLFLPLTAPRYLLPAMPLYILYIGADVPEGVLAEAAQNVPITVFIFVATVFAFRRTGRILVRQVRVERRIVTALLLTALVFFVRDSVSSPYDQPWQWGERDVADVARLSAVELLPNNDVPVRASVSILPLLSERLGIYELATDQQLAADDLDAVIDAAVLDVDWLIFDRNDEGIDDEELLGRYRARLAERGWQPVDRNDEARIDVYQFTGIIEAAPLPDEGVVAAPLVVDPEEDGPDG